MDLLNLQTGKAESPENPLDAIAAGTHVPANGKVLIDPEGKPVVSPTSDIPANLTRFGYKVPTQEQLTEFAKQAKYGEGTANEAKAFAEGAGRGASFGATDYLETKLGVDPDAIAERRARNPASALGGELTGAVGSAVLAPELSPVGLAGKGAGLITRALEAGKVAEGAGLGARVLAHAQDIGAKALGSSVEGALFGLGENATEASLGDPDLNADKFMRNVGYGAFLGGSLGAGSSVLGKVIPPAVGAAREATQGAWRKLFGGEIPPPEPVLKDASLVSSPGSEPQAMAATGTDGMPQAPQGEVPVGDVSGPVAEGISTPGPTPNSGTGMPSPMSLGYEDGIIPKMIAKAKGAMGGDSEEVLQGFRDRSGPQGEVLNPKERAGFVRDTVSALQDSHDAAEEALSSAQPARASETTKLLADAPVGPAAAESDALGQRLAKLTADMEARPALYPARFAAKLGDLTADFRTEAFGAESAADHFQAINQAKKQLDALSKWDEVPSAADADAMNAVRALRGEFRSALENENVWGEAAARQAAVNRATTDYLASRKEFQKRFMTKTVQRGKAVYQVEPRKVNGFFNMINDPRGEIRGQAISEHLRNTSALVDELSKTHEAAPIKGFDPEASKAGLSGNAAAIERARNVVSSQPGQGYGFFTSLLLGHTLGGPLATVGTVAKALGKPDVLATIEKGAGKTSDIIGRTAKAIFRPVSESVGKGSGVLKDALSPKERAQRFNKRQKDLLNLTQNPEVMQDRLHQLTGDGFEAAPKTMQAMQIAALRATDFLSAKLPKPLTPPLPYDKPYEPSDRDIKTFDRYFDAVHDPLTLLSEAKAGAIKPETMEAVQAVYPKLFSEIQSEVMSAMNDKSAKGDRSLPYQTRLTVAKLIGAPVDSSMTPQTLQAVHQATAGAIAQQQAQKEGPKPTAGGMAKLAGAGRFQTTFQEAAERQS